jgi:hypothetical protein
MSSERVAQISRIFVRFALGSAFLSALADRFGVYGPPGSKYVGFGDWLHFVKFVAVLNWFLPKGFIPTVAVLETVIELALGVALLLGIYQRQVALSSAALLMSFALTMSIALRINVALSYSVFSAAGAALLLGTATLPSAARPAASSSASTKRAAVEHIDRIFDSVLSLRGVQWAAGEEWLSRWLTSFRRVPYHKCALTRSYAKDLDIPREY